MRSLMGYDPLLDSHACSVFIMALVIIYKTEFLLALYFYILSYEYRWSSLCYPALYPALLTTQDQLLLPISKSQKYTKFPLSSAFTAQMVGTVV